MGEGKISDKLYSDPGLAGVKCLYYIVLEQPQLITGQNTFQQKVFLLSPLFQPKSIKI